MPHTERMWEKYYKLSSSQEFKASWNEFRFNGSPIFQFVTKAILEMIIKMQFPVAPPGGETTSASALDFSEAKALRYCGGYILRSLKSKITKSKNPLKNSLLLCLDDLLEGKIN